MAAEHMRAFANLPGATLVGSFSRSKDRAEALAANYPGMTVSDSLHQLYEQTRADLVVVTVNELSMNAIAQECFAYPWTVLLEKPAGYNLSDASAILNAARAKSRRVYVALNRRSYSSMRMVRDRLHNINGNRFIKVQDQEDIVEACRAGRPDIVIANWMYANAIHVIDCFRVFGRGTVTKVMPIRPWNPKLPGFVVAHIEFASGDFGLYEAVWNGPGPWAVTINACDERYELRPLEQAAVQLNGQRHLTTLPTERMDQQYKPGLRFQAEQAVRAARGEPSDLPTIEDAFQSMRLVAQIYGHDTNN